jgi:DnaJ-class molecular chaperone
MRPTHVMVGIPVDCKTCDGTGEVQHGFVRLPNGRALCPECGGSKLRHEAMPLVEFAKLFTYGEVHGYNRDGRTIENEVRVRDSDERGEGR